MIYINKNEDRIDFLDINDNFHRINGAAMITENNQTWWKNGKYHRLGGPAIIRGNYEQWWVNGLRHRIDGPAVFWYGALEWFENGKRHRLDGPAMVYQDKTRYWYINGMEYSETEYHDKLKEMGVVV